MKRLTHLACTLALVSGVLEVGAGCGDDTSDGGGSGPGAGGGAESICGDNLLDDDLGEECDDGDFDDTDDCKTDCTLNYCGDGVVHVGEEECDDGNDDDDDKCKSDCTAGITGCGNGEVDDGEDCDDGNLVDDDGCSRTCVAARCGDGVVQAGEDCDDGNGEDGDACSNACTSGDGCGNGTTEGDEACDDGNRSNGDDCLDDCTEAGCGDGYAQAGVEACDDGNDDDGDFCRNDCTLNEEIDGACPGAPISIPFGSHGYEWTTEGAENTAEGSCEGGDSPEVAFEVTPEEDGTLTITLSSIDGSFDAVLYARTGSCEDGDEIDCSDFAAENGSEQIEMEVGAGDTIWVFADGYAAQSGAFTIDFTLEGDEPPPPPEGDTCPGIDIFVDTVELGEASGDTSALADDYVGEGQCALGDGPDIVYAITPLDDGLITVLVDADFDVVLYTLIDCGVTSSQLECVDATTTGSETLENLPGYAGETLYVVVDGYDGASGTFDMLVELAPEE